MIEHGQNLPNKRVASIKARCMEHIRLEVIWPLEGPNVVIRLNGFTRNNATHCLLRVKLSI